MTIISQTHFDLGQKIKTLRKEKGLIQAQLADLVNFDRSYVGFIERGEKNPTLSTIIKIAGALKVEVSDLF